MPVDAKSPLVKDDASLMASLAQGDTDALEGLMQRLERPVFALVLGILRDRQAAEDVTSETFVKVWHKASSYDPGQGRVASWIFSIAHNRALDLLRSRKVRSAVTLTPDGEPREWAAVPAPAGQSPWQGQRMREAIAQLSDIQAQAVRLAYFEGLSRDEMASRLGVPVGTVKTRLREGLLKLKQLYLDPEADYDAWKKGPV